ncbi:MAG: hypothetical protein OEM85_09690 [Gammaproteobacteria bacterium]|nr:hypothetical protein [Gammaproteobacteria bacterium]
MSAEREGGNGIVVGKPKQFPYSYLEEQLSQLSQQLEQINAIDAAGITAGLGSTQGSTLRQRQASLSITPIPLPKVETVLGAAEGEKQSGTTQTITQEAYAPAAPSTAAATAPMSPVTNFGSGAQDLLSEQVNLQYQISNLRLLLNQSITDRFISKNSKSGSRRHALLGFRISLIPRDDHDKSAAVVKITVKPKDDSDAKPSIVALMPEEKTYNAVALTKKSGSFGGAALSGIFSFGLSTSASSEIFYMYKDSDTVAFEAAKNDDNSLTFGWQFRPVLNQVSVNPGTRYLFVALSLDAFDSGSASYELETTAEAYWVKYNAKRRLGDDKVKSKVSFQKENLDVVGSAALQEALAPQIKEALATAVGGGNLLVTVKGENLFRGSAVFIGDKALNPQGASLTHRSDERLEFVAPATDVLLNEIRITGAKYGFSTLVRQELEDVVGFNVGFMTVAGSPNGDLRRVTISLESRVDQSLLDEKELGGRNVFMLVGREAFELPNERWKAEDGKLQASVGVPSKLLEKDQEVTVLVPFLGAKFHANWHYYPPTSVKQAKLLSADGSDVTWGIFGNGLSDHEADDGSKVPALKLYAGKFYQHNVVTDTLVTIEGKRSELGSQKSIVAVISGRVEPTVIPAPNVPTPKPIPTISGAASVPKNSAVHVEISGKALKQIKSVQFNGKSLIFSSPSDDKLVVFLTRDVTKESGTVSLIGQHSDNSVVPILITVK